MAEHRFELERFLSIRSALAPSVSHDGQHVAYLSDMTGIYQLWRGTIGGNAPTQLTFTSERVRGGWYRPRGSDLVFAMDVGGNERTQLYWLHGIGREVRADGWDWTALTGQPEAIHAFGGWSHDGLSLAFSANRVQDSRFDIYAQALGGAPRLLAEGPGGFYLSVEWSPDDRCLLVSRDESSFNQDLYILDIANGETRHITPHTGEAAFFSARWWPTDNRSIA